MSRPSALPPEERTRLVLSVLAGEMGEEAVGPARVPVPTSTTYGRSSG